MNPNQILQNLRRKYSLVAQKNSVPYSDENGDFIKWLPKFISIYDNINVINSNTANVDINLSDKNNIYLHTPTQNTTYTINKNNLQNIDSNIIPKFTLIIDMSSTLYTITFTNISWLVQEPKFDKVNKYFIEFISLDNGTTWIGNMVGSSINGIQFLPDSTDIDTLKNEGEYWINKVTSTEGLPNDLPLTREQAHAQQYSGVCAYVKVVNTHTTNTNPNTYSTLDKTQICYFYPYRAGSPAFIVSSCIGIYIRTVGTKQTPTPSKWSQFDRILNTRRIVHCSHNTVTDEVFIPDTLYPNTTYYFCDLFSEDFNTVMPITSLTLNNIIDSSNIIEIYFKTDSTFSGITANQIKGWIGNTSLDTDSVYKITISNLIAKIEKVILA